jgi:predicted DNA binding CopG/RHH family protein
MRKHYDFSNARRNPYAAQLKKPVTIRLDEGSISYFKGMADETGIPYQSLINLYLKDCAATGKRLNLAWKAGLVKRAA